jgi:hypothetical protein
MNTEWLDEAHRRFPDRKEVFSYVDTPFDIWTNLRDVFKAAYTYPYNESDIRAIYEYAEWSCKQPQGDSAKEDLLTVVAVGFYEYIPEVPAAIKDLPRWFKLDEILTMKEILSYRVGSEGFELLLEAYPKSQRLKPKRKS